MGPIRKSHRRCAPPKELRLTSLRAPPRSWFHAIQVPARSWSMPVPETNHPPIGPAHLDAAERAQLRQFRSRRTCWKRFAAGFRGRSEPLLGALPNFANAVLVAGCQRSGTTMLTRIIANARGFRRFELTHDDELDAALVLAGAVHLPGNGRYCFQTTYLNDRYPEYGLVQPGQRLIWVVRNPHSVVYSMVYNWRRYALEELYDSCGKAGEGDDSQSGAWWRKWTREEQIRKACHAYRGKAAQVFAIRTLLGGDKVMVVDYDAMVREPAAWLPGIFDFIGEPYDSACVRRVRGDSLKKASKLTGAEKRQVDRIAMPIYQQTLALSHEARDVA